MASSDTAGPAATASRPGSSRTWIKGSGFFLVFSVATVVILLRDLFIGAYLHARCAFDLLGEHSTRASLSFLGLSGYGYCVFFIPETSTT